MPDTGTGVRDSEAHEPDTIISRVGFLPDYSRAGPGHDRRLLAHRGTDGAKGEVCRAATNGLLPVRRIVVHVALARMTLAPGVFVRDDVFRFGKIGGVLVLGYNKVIRDHQDPMRGYVMTVTAVIVGCRTYEKSSEGIDPCARTNASLVTIQAGVICVGTAGPKMGTTYTIASKVAGV